MWICTWENIIELNIRNWQALCDCSKILKHFIGIHITPSCLFQIDLGKQPEVSRREPVSTEEWAKNMDSEGRILNVDYIKQSIFKGVTCFSKVSKTCGWLLVPFFSIPNYGYTVFFIHVMLYMQDFRHKPVSIVGETL